MDETMNKKIRIKTQILKDQIMIIPTFGVRVVRF